MATNLFIGYPEVGYSASSVVLSHSYSTSYPVGNLFHGGSSRYAELASEAQFTNYLDFSHPAAAPSSTSQELVFLNNVSLLRASGVHSVVMRELDFVAPSGISNLQFWLDPGRNVTVDSSQRVSAITERSSNAIAGSQGTTGDRPFYTNMSNRANYFNASEDFTNASWAKDRCTVSAYSIRNPINGLQTGSTLTEDTANGQHGFRQSPLARVVVNKDYRVSVYLKKGDRDWAFIIFESTGFTVPAYGFFNLNTGVVGNTSGTITEHTITAVGNGWYRCTLAATANGAANGIPNISICHSTANGTTTYIGDGTSKMYVWGAQFHPTNCDTNYLYSGTNGRGYGVNSNRTLFHTTNDGLSFGNPAALAFSGDFSGLIVYRSAYDTSVAETLTLIDHEDVNVSGWAYYLSTSLGRVTFRSNQAGVNQTVTDVFARSTNGLNIDAFTLTGTTVQFYRHNGIGGKSSGSSGSITHHVAPTQNFFLGSASGASSALEGHICEVILYNKALSSGELDSLYTYAYNRWGRTPVFANHDIQTATLTGPQRNSIASAASFQNLQVHRLEFDSELSSIRRSGKIFGTGCFDLGRDPIYGRIIKEEIRAHNNRALVNRYEFFWGGITNQVRQNFETYIGKWIDAYTFVLYAQTDTAVLNGHTAVEVEILSYEFTPKENSKNNLKMICREVL